MCLGCGQLACIASWVHVLFLRAYLTMIRKWITLGPFSYYAGRAITLQALCLLWFLSFLQRSFIAIREFFSSSTTADSNYIPTCVSLLHRFIHLPCFPRIHIYMPMSWYAPHIPISRGRVASSNMRHIRPQPLLK